jgi:hypothetical protein
MIAQSVEGHFYHTLVLKEKQHFWKRILIVDDDVDITITFKTGIEDSNNDARKRIEVHTYNHPMVTLSEFKPNFYGLLLVDIRMPDRMYHYHNNGDIGPNDVSHLAI